MTDLKVGSPGVGLRWSLSPEQVEEPCSDRVSPPQCYRCGNQHLSPHLKDLNKEKEERKEGEDAATRMTLQQNLPHSPNSLLMD